MHAPRTNHPTMQLNRLLLSVVLLAAASAAAVAQRPIRTFLGSQPGAGFGRALASIADVDGDGRLDLVVGEPQRNNPGASRGGAVRVLALGPGTTVALAAIPFADYQFGTSVAGLGDVDGDGVPDFAGGAPLAGNYEQGFVRVCSGRTGGMLFDVFGEPRSRLGTAICAGGDADRDGRADVVIAAPHNSNQRPLGMVRAYSRFGLQLWQIAGSDMGQIGTGLASIGDVDGDGQPDLAIGEPGFDFGQSNSGRIAVHDARNGGGLSRLWEVYSGFQGSEQVGRVVAAAGDIDGDGTPDVLVGSALQSVRILSGRTGALLGVARNPDFGTFTLAGIGDFDGDGRQDFAVGNPLANFGAGAVWVYSTNPVQLQTVIHGEPLSGFGASLAGVGDLDGDGRDDFAVGAPTFVSNGLVVGRITVHGFAIRAIAEPFGTGCTGTGRLPALGFAGMPVLGTSFEVRCSNLRRDVPGLWVFGWSDSRFGATPLPLDLQAFGIPGCQLLVSADATQVFVPSTVASWSLTLPALPHLAGLGLFTQACQLDSARTGGLVFSNGGRLRVGHY